MTLDGANKRMKENIGGEDKRVEVISKLQNIKAKLLHISDILVEKQRTL